MSYRERRALLEALVDDVAPAGWRDDRRWQALLTATALCEPWAGAAPAYVSSNGEPHADTFMASAGPGPVDAAGWIGWAIAAAHAAVEVLDRRDHQFPGQPLRVWLVRKRGLCTVVPATEVRTVAFAVGGRVVPATLDPRGPAHDHELARRLAALAAAVPGALPPVAVGPPLVTVAIGDEALAVAHHGHRRAWTDGGGTWLGVARAGGLTVVSTCHLVVDGWGHAHVAADLPARIDRGAVRTLAAIAAASLGTAAPPPLAPLSATVPLGLAWRRLPAPTPRFTRQAWALGRALAARADGGWRARGATLQIPVAPGPPDDPTRFGRRVRTALATVRCPDGAPEPLDDFAARARRAVADEAVGVGLVGHLLAALDGAPLPLALKRRWLGGARLPAAGGPAELLAGDGCLSLLRLAGVPPLVAASPPARLLAPDDDEATAVLTVIDDGRGGATATLAGRGRAATVDGASALLDAWASALTDDEPAAAAPVAT